MSSETNKKNPIEEMIEVLKAVGDNLREEEDANPTSPEGFDSLIPDDLVKKMQGIEKLVNETKTDMVKFSAEMLFHQGDNHYAQLQAVMFLEAHKDLVSASARLAGIHHLDKPMIDEFAKDGGMTPDAFIHKTMHEMALASVLNHQ